MTSGRKHTSEREVVCSPLEATLLLLWLQRMVDTDLKLFFDGSWLLNAYNEVTIGKRDTKVVTALRETKETCMPHFSVAPIRKVQRDVSRHSSKGQQCALGEHGGSLLGQRARLESIQITNVTSQLHDTTPFREDVFFPERQNKKEQFFRKLLSPDKHVGEVNVT